MNSPGENEKLREDFNAHIEEGSIPPKVRKTINSLSFFWIFVAAFLEKKTRKNSSNRTLSRLR